MATNTKEPKKATKIMIDVIGKQLVDYTINKPSDKPISFVLCKEGVVEVRKTPVGQFAKLHTKIDKNNENLVLKCMSFDETQLNKLESASSIPLFRMDLPRIPLKFLEEIIHFFKAVHDKQQTEAAALIRWNLEKKEYYVEIPGGPKDKHQDLSGGGVQYKPDSKDSNPIVMDLHSHHTMSPFFSGTDDGDEQSTQLYAVIGHIDHSQEAVNIRVRMGGTDLLTNIPVEKIFDKNVTFDPTWMDSIRKPPIQATKTGDKDYGPYGYGEHTWKRRGRRHRRSLHRYPPGFPDNWEDRLDDHAREAGDAPTLQEIMEAEQGITGYNSDTPPAPGVPGWQGVDDPNIAGVFDDVWQAVEREFYDRPEIFCSQEAIKEMKDFLADRMEGISATQIVKDATDNGGPEPI